MAEQALQACALAYQVRSYLDVESKKHLKKIQDSIKEFQTKINNGETLNDAEKLELERSLKTLSVQDGISPMKIAIPTAILQVLKKYIHR